MDPMKIAQLNAAPLVEDDALINPKKGRKKKVKLDCPAFYIGTDYEADHLDGQVILLDRLSSVQELAGAKSKLTPKQLKGLVELQTTHRPRLDLSGTTNKDGKQLLFLLGPDAPNGEIGWYLKDGDTLTAVDDCEGLYETPDTYNENDERQRNARERNAQAISAAARRLVTSYSDILRDQFWVGRAQSVGDHLVFVCLNNEGVLTLMDINYTKGAANKLHDRDVYALLETWANQVGLSYDVYKQKIVTKDGVLDEVSRNALHLKLGKLYRFNIPAAPVRAALPQLANQTQINSLSEEMRDLEAQVIRGDLDLVDHRTVASTFLKVQGTPEEVALYNAMVATWIEGMVMRAIYPGANFRYCLILTGPQQCGKTAFFSIIGTKEHMTPLQNLNSSETSHSSISHSDIQRRLSTNNVAVINEIGAAFRRLDSELFKDFLDSTTVEFTPKYMNESVRQFRTAVFCGTNNSDDILVDDTGSTRFWFVPVGVTRHEPLDFDALTESRNGLVASALLSVLDKVSADPSVVDSLGLTAEEQDFSEKLNRNRAKYNAYTDVIEGLAYLATEVKDLTLINPLRQFITLKEVQDRAGLSRDQTNSRAMDDIKSALARLGYESIGRQRIPRIGTDTAHRTIVYSLEKKPWNSAVYVEEKDKPSADDDY